MSSYFFVQVCAPFGAPVRTRTRNLRSEDECDIRFTTRAYLLFCVVFQLLLFFTVFFNCFFALFATFFASVFVISPFLIIFVFFSAFSLVGLFCVFESFYFVCVLSSLWTAVLFAHFNYLFAVFQSRFLSFALFLRFILQIFAVLFKSLKYCRIFTFDNCDYIKP